MSFSVRATSASILVCIALVACSSSDDKAAAAAPACNPAGTFQLQDPVFAGAGGAFCTTSAQVDQAAGKDETIVVTLKTATTYTIVEQGETAGDDDVFTLNTANCTLTRTMDPSSQEISDGNPADNGFADETGTIVATFTNNSANVNIVTTRNFAKGAGNATGIPCSLVETQDGTKTTTAAATK